MKLPNYWIWKSVSSSSFHPKINEFVILAETNWNYMQVSDKLSRKSFMAHTQEYRAFQGCGWFRLPFLPFSLPHIQSPTILVWSQPFHCVFGLRRVWRRCTSHNRTTQGWMTLIGSNSLQTGWDVKTYGKLHFSFTHSESRAIWLTGRDAYGFDRMDNSTLWHPPRIQFYRETLFHFSVVPHCVRSLTDQTNTVQVPLHDDEYLPSRVLFPILKSPMNKLIYWPWVGIVECNKM
jgi:hypothetical protein